MSVAGGKAEIGDQRSLKSLAGSASVSETTTLSVRGRCDLIVAAVAVTASRVTAKNPVIVRCFVMWNLLGSAMPHLTWVTGTFARVHRCND